MRYRAHQDRERDARQSCALSLLLRGLIAILLITYGLSEAVHVVLRLLAGTEVYLDLLGAMNGGDRPDGLMVMLLMMGTVGVAVTAVAALLHDRSLTSLTGPPEAALRDGMRVLVALGALLLALAVLPPWGAAEAQPGLPPGLWLSLLPLTLSALLIQTGSEELLFRGYLQSQLAARLRHPAIWLTAPAALFAIVHYSPETYGENAWAVVGWAFLFGLAAADLTARAGNLGPAIALHLANNVMAVAVLALDGPMSGLALYRLPFGPHDTDALRAALLPDLATLGVSWLAARLALRR